jgi:hypothetical protein
MFEGLREAEISNLSEDEFDDYPWMLQGLARRVESSFQSCLAELSRGAPGGNVVVYGTVALHSLVRFGEILTGLRDLESRIAIGFPGHEQGGKLHFLGQPDGGNYLAVKLFW